MSKVYLKDVVTRIKDKVDKDKTDLEYYIGGEHFDNGEIQITKKGVIAGSTIGPAFHMRFVPGDVLLMSRNPHLRKAGVVDFEGICSDVSYVCRTKDENVLMQKFLPFIFQSDDFWRFAEENKKGSTNFFLNWSDFEKYEFNLPPIETQRKLVEILWSFEDTKTAYKKLLDKTDELVKSQFIEMFDGKFPLVKTEDVCHFITKGTTPKGDGIIKKYSAELVPYLKVYNLSFDGTLLFDYEPQYVTQETHYGFLARSKVYPGDVLMNIVGPPLGKFALVTSEHPEWNINQAIAIFRAKEMILPEYLLHALMQPKLIGPFIEKAQGVRQMNFSLEQCRKLEIPLPGLDIQSKFVEFVHQSDKSKFELKQAIIDVDNLAKALMQQEIN